jgi:hypothetical protein
MKKLATTFGLLALMLIVTSFTTPNEIGGKSSNGGLSTGSTFNIGGKSSNGGLSTSTFNIGGKSSNGGLSTGTFNIGGKSTNTGL